MSTLTAPPAPRVGPSGRDPSAAAISQRVLGIDPGSRHTGWALVLRDAGRFQLTSAGAIHTDPEAPMAERLACIMRDLRRVVGAQQPTVAAIEVIFSHRSATSALTLGQARGVALATLADSGLTVHEYNASTIKMSVTGSGKADKDQVGRMVAMLLGEGLSAFGGLGSDALDACAIAMTHHLHAGRVEAAAQMPTAGKGARARRLDPRLPASWGIKLPTGGAKGGGGR